ncbi:MAG: hypothetical protein WDZ80_03175 [Candidatus Paceibacterota bacterium]
MWKIKFNFHKTFKFCSTNLMTSFMGLSKYSLELSDGNESINDASSYSILENKNLFLYSPPFVTDPQIFEPFSMHIL